MMKSKAVFICLTIFAVFFSFLIFLPQQGPASVSVTAPEPANQQPQIQTKPLQVTVTVPETKNWITGRLSKSTVYDMLVSHGVSPSQVLHLSRSFKPVFDFRYAKPRHEYSLCLTKDNCIDEFVYKTGIIDEYVAEKKTEGGFNVYKREIPLTKTVHAKQFVVDSSLYKAVIKTGESGHMVERIVDIFSWDIDFYTYTRKGDTITVLFEKMHKDSQFVGYGDILAAVYEGKRKSVKAFLFDNDGSKGYYDESGRPVRKMFLRTPVKFGRQTSGYSIRRFHPVSKKYKKHTGIDYGARQGTPIFATAGGRITFSGWKSGYGKLVIIKHPNGYQTYYGHCSRLVVKKGALVEQGQTIAKVGQTGVATGPHVHYEVRIKGVPINPNKVEKTKGLPLKKSAVALFRETVASRMIMAENMLDVNEDVKLTGLAKR